MHSDAPHEAVFPQDAPEVLPIEVAFTVLGLLFPPAASLPPCDEARYRALVAEGLSEWPESQG